MATASVLAFTATTPRRKHVIQLAVRHTELNIVEADPDPDAGTSSDTYELRVFDVSVLVRLREQWKGQRLVPYGHVEHEAERPRLLLVKVDNRGETEHR